MVVSNANSANSQLESCDRIRTLIRANTGIPPRVDTGLLQKLARPECRFSEAEVYRAAYGDKPMPKKEVLAPDARREHDDDDD
ncbi:MAG: hypothetical protein NT159_01905 [Proteobacteria bacterium]|nr:hypothetical protein [Pseudomonadota bacterium]